MELLTKEELLREYQLNQMIRYNTRTKICNESVAAHTCFVTMFCLKIISQLELNTETQRDILILAALHDAPESEMSDIPHNVKEQFPDIYKMCAKIEEQYYNDFWPTYTNIISHPRPIVLNIMLLADIYSVMQYCYNEMELGNQSEEIYHILYHAKERAMECNQTIEELISEGEK